jgi:hypothetical protein
MTPFGPELDLTDLDGTNGITINGIASGDRAGNAVSDAGDVNGDGIADFIIGAPSADPNGFNSAGESYVVFGGNTLLSNLDADGNLDLATLDGTNGFVIDGKAANDELGRAVSRAGDVNGDGVDDLIVGAPRAEPELNDGRGQSYVIFGIQGARPTARVDLNTLGTDTDPNGGFAISGIDGQDQAGFSVSSIGDINNDNFDDLIVGAPFAELDSMVSTQGEGYVILGGSDIGDGGNLSLAAIDGNNGFVIRGEDFANRAGSTVSEVGDVNNDGTPDFIIGAPNTISNGLSGAGKAYVIFGDAVVPNGVLDLANLDPSNGFVLEGQAVNNRLGSAVSGLGDINDDFDFGQTASSLC